MQDNIVARHDVFGGHMDVNLIHTCLLIHAL